MRWRNEAVEAVGGTIIDESGVDDWQGWGVLLSEHDDGTYHIIYWSYGSCSGCDAYERMAYEFDEEYDHEFTGFDRVVNAMKRNIEVYTTLEDARLAFDGHKGW